MEPPATPPFKSSISAPGLLTSKDLMTINLGEAEKSLTGTGMVLTMNSLTASMFGFINVWIIQLVDLGVGVTQLDGNVTFQFVFETDGLDTGYGLDDGGLTVGDVTNGTDVDGGLSVDDFW
ncbi:hypothetical protein WICPIJ_003102 [Wickerhamomyces pijperi]|uniref:Uncharacterized protein n=1 Tax=Wickerhamomyces pijperi TaxID=599730 RepID=A0A9P8Q7W9_WICPI|nr:hypothetical protein WICPIJ_003102 [Wickerhamomyces pijperi]